MTPQDSENPPPRDVRYHLRFSLPHHSVTQEKRAELGGQVSNEKPADAVAEEPQRNR